MSRVAASNTHKASKIKRFFGKKRGGRSFTGNVILGLAMMGFAIIFLMPVILLVNNAFKPLHELLRIPPTIWVRDFTLENFFAMGNIFSTSLVPFWRYLFNSLFIVGIGTLGQILLASMAAYPLAKFEFFGEGFLNKLIIIALMFSPAVTAVHNFLIMARLGMIDTYWALIIPSFASTLGLFLMRNFMSQVPSSLIEAAQIDGSSEFRTLWRVVMPAVKPAWITLFILSFQSMWQAAGTSVIFTESLKPLPAAISQIASGITIARMGEVMAVSLIMFLIPVVIFIIMQSNVLETMTTSGMKE